MARNKITAAQLAGLGVDVPPSPKRKRASAALPRCLQGFRTRDIEIMLPWPPSFNNDYWCRRRDGGVYLSNKAKLFRSNVWVAVVEKQCGHVEGRLSVQLYLHAPDSDMNWDIDNRAKATLDALQHVGVFENDKQIDKLLIVRGGGMVKGGGCGVFIQEIMP